MPVAPQATAMRANALRQHCIHVEWPYISEPISLPITRQMQITTTASLCQFNNNDKNELKEKKQDDRRYITWLKDWPIVHNTQYTILYSCRTLLCSILLFFFVLCILCCQFFWIVYFWLHLWYSLTFII